MQRIKKQLVSSSLEPLKGYPHNESIDESVAKAVQGLNDLGNKMKGRDQKDIRRIEKLYRSGNTKVFQGAIRALDTDLRDQVKDIFDALDMVKQGVIESVDLDEGTLPPALQAYQDKKNGKKPKDDKDEVEEGRVKDQMVKDSEKMSKKDFTKKYGKANPMIFMKLLIIGL